MTDVQWGYIIDFLIIFIPYISITFMSFWMESSGEGDAIDRRWHILFIQGIVFIISSYGATYIADTCGNENISKVLVNIRFLFSGFCYILRPVILATLNLEITGMDGIWKRIIRFPAMFGAFLYTVNFFHPFIFYISETNYWKTTAFPALSVMLTWFYCVLLWLLILQRMRDEDIIKRARDLLVMFLISIGFLADWLQEGLRGGATIAIALLVYYLVTVLQMKLRVVDRQKEELQMKKQALMISQIQPHFLYNTLNAIYYLCTQDPEKAADTTLKFSNYLRNNLDFSRQESPLIPIEEELQHTRTYTDIEKVRFRRLKVIYDIQDGEYMIPPLTIQPMVENAIRHGVRGKKDGCILVKLFEENQKHYVVIQDNGTGVVDQNPVVQREGIGIANTKARIEQILNGSFQIEMVPEKGTTVTFVIPK